LAIKKFVLSPDDIECKEEVNEFGFFVPHVYNVKAVYKKGKEFVRNFKIMCMSQSASDPVPLTVNKDNL